MPADQQKLRGSLMMNGYNFTERVRQVLAMAREEAARLRHEYVGTEHMLLGLIREGEGVAATVLQNLEVDLDELTVAIETTVKKGAVGQVTGPDLPYTSRAKKVLELAMSQARELNHSYVGTEHLLLGLLAEQKGIAAQVLHHANVTLGNASAETIRILGTGKIDGPRMVREAVGRELTARAPAPPPLLSDRLRDIMGEAEDVAMECMSAELLPIHLAIALVRHEEGLANAVIDRLGCDRPSLLRALEGAAKADPASALPEEPVTIGQPMIALQRYIESEGHWRATPRSTLHVLLALLDTQPEIASIFGMQALNANRVRTEARRMSG